MTAQPRHFLNIDDFTYPQLRGMLDVAVELKARPAKGDRPALLKDKVLAMIFDKQSTRTRVSFDVGMRQLGGETIMLSGQEMQLSREETLADTARGVFGLALLIALAMSMAARVSVSVPNSAGGAVPNTLSITGAALARAISIRRGFSASGVSRTRSMCSIPCSCTAPETRTWSASAKRRRR